MTTHQIMNCLLILIFFLITYKYFSEEIFETLRYLSKLSKYTLCGKLAMVVEERSCYRHLTVHGCLKIRKSSLEIEKIIKGLYNSENSGIVNRWIDCKWKMLWDKSKIDTSISKGTYGMKICSYFFIVISNSIWYMSLIFYI